LSAPVNRERFGVRAISTKDRHRDGLLVPVLGDDLTSREKFSVPAPITIEISVTCKNCTKNASLLARHASKAL
jgi:hypothetical protein